MKNLALLLLCATAAQINAGSGYPNGCPKDWTIRKLLPHPNCNKFYLCWNGQLLVQSCPSRFYFTVVSKRCEWQSVPDCRDLDVPDDIKSDETDDANQNEGFGHCDPSKAPSICAKKGSDGVLIAHEKCNHYYICDHGKPIAQCCPANLFFNPKNDECDWPNNVDCNGRDIPGPCKDGNVGAGNSDPSNAPSICAAANSSGVLVAHETCNKYYICDHGKPIARRCPANLFFNPKNDECDWPSNVDCNGRDVPGPCKDGNVGAGNSDPSLAPSICAAANSSGVLVAHEICNKYYVCVNGKPLAQRCPTNLFFNPKKDECDWPRNVCCKGRIIFGPREDTQKDWYLTISDDYGKYGYVGAGNSYPSKAPYICAAKNSSGVLVAHEKCNKYYICDHGKPVAQRCPANLFFNPKKDECDWPKNVNCRDKATSGSSESSSKEDSSEEDSSEEDSSEEDSSKEDSSEEISAENEIDRDKFLKRLLRTFKEIVRRLFRH